MTGGKTNDQICRIDCSGGFVEILNSVFEGYGKGRLGKVIMNLCTYDSNCKQTGSIQSYIDIPSFLGLVDDVRFGRMKTLAKAEREAVKAGQRSGGFPNAIWQEIKTTPREKLKKPRKDGLDEVRILEIIPATKTKIPSLMITATKCGGEKDKDGNIQKKINYKDKTSYEKIMITVSEEEFRCALIYTQMHIQAFYNRKWMNGAYDIENTPNTSSQNQTAPSNNTNNNNVTNFNRQPVRSTNSQPNNASTRPKSQPNNAPVNQTTQTPPGKKASLNMDIPSDNKNIFGAQEINDDEDFPFASNQ